MNFITRNYTSEDRDFIYNSYLKSFHKNYPVKYVPPTLYYDNQSDVLDFLMKRSNVALAVFPEDASEIMSYVIYERINEALVIHYVYTKFLSRRKEIAKRLVESIWDGKELIIYTHMVDDFRYLKWKIPGASFTYDPFLITNLRLQDK